MKDYKKILEGVVNIINTAEKSDIGFTNICTYIGENCPELKESEDERMIQYFKDLAPFDKADELYEKYGFSHKDAIAWLEKQGEQKIKTPEESLGIDSDTYNKIVDECIYGEQKHTDNVEPKFHKGEWIIHRGTENIYQVVARIDNQYQLKYGDNYTIQKCDDVDRCARLWDIAKDAKDGDVLFTSSTASHETFMFKNIDEKGNAKCYFAYDSEDGFREGKYHFIGRATKCKPATKEQRDLLFQKMNEAGYEWDAKKKELIKIEHKPAWSEKDNEHVNSLLKRLDGFCRKEFTTTRFAINDDENWLKSLKDKYTWKPSEEQMNTLEYYMHTLVCSEHKEVLFGLYADLKKLMEK